MQTMAVGAEQAASQAHPPTFVELAALQTTEVPDLPQRPFTLFPQNPLSACTFSWVFRLLWQSLTHGPASLLVRMQEKSRAEPASDLLSAAWARQPITLLGAAGSAYGRRYALLALWKLSWAVFTWLSAYWLLEQMMRNPSMALAFALLIAAVLSAISIQVLFFRIFFIIFYYF